MPLFSIKDQKATFRKPTSFVNERQLQRLIEANLQNFLDANLVASEFMVNVDGVQGGRIDTLAIDKENTPVIIEYKKTQSESVINQALFYLEWLVTHKGDFEIAVQKKLGKDASVNWENPRVIVIAERFSPYDVYGVRRMGANVELWTYRYYDNEFLLFEAAYVPSSTAKPGRTAAKMDGGKDSSEVSGSPKEIIEEEKPTYDLNYHLRGKSQNIKEVFDTFRERIFELQSADGELVEVFRKMYIGYKRGKNFCEVHLYQNELVIWLDLPFSDLKDPHKLAVDASGKGHWGTGEVEIRLSNLADVDSVMELVKQAYEYVA